MNSDKPSRRFGFTLIELLVVIAIIAILAAMLLPAIAGVSGRVNSQDATAPKAVHVTQLFRIQNRAGANLKLPVWDPREGVALFSICGVCGATTSMLSILPASGGRVGASEQEGV